VPTLDDDIVFNNVYIDVYATNVNPTGFQVRSITFEDNFTPDNTMVLQNSAGASRTLRLGNNSDPAQPVIALNTTSGTVTIKQTGSAGNPLLVSLMTDAEFYVNNGATLNVESTMSGAFGVRKTGAGTLVLSGAHTYSGGTVVSNGTLQVYTSFNSGGAFSAVDGTVFSVKAADAANPLRASALTLGSDGGGVTCELDLGASGSRSVPVVQATNLTTSGTVTLYLKGSGFSIGTQVPLISFVGNIGGSGFDAFHLETLPDGVSGNLVSNATTVSFLVTDAPVIKWTGAIDGNWDIGTANWFDPIASLATTYSDGIGVRFDDSATTKSVNIAQDVAPGGITISNSVDYDFSGPGKISGAFFKKEGSGMVTLANQVANDYNGNTTVSAGALKLGLENAIPGGVGKGSVFLDGTLDLNGFSQTLGALNGAGVLTNSVGATISLSIGGNNASGSFTGPIKEGSGILTLTKAGSGTQVLGANNVYSGETILTGGLLQVTADNSLGAGAISVTGSAAGIAADASPRTLTNDLSLSIQTTFNTASSGQLTLTGSVNYNGANRILNVEGEVVMTGAQSSGAAQKRGDGTLIIKGVCDWTATADLRSGVTIFDGATVDSTGPIRPNSNIAGGTSRMIVTNGAVLNLHSATANVRSGWDGNTTATNYLDIAATIRTPDAIPVNGGVAIGPSPGYITLLPGGDVEAYTIRIEAGAVFSSFSFDGGILRARADNANFFTGLTEAYVRSRGANIDTAGWNISIAQDLLDGGGNGGLVKTGAGTLLMNGANTYTGNTVISNGGFGGTGVIAGPVNITSAAILTPGVTVGTLTINNTLNLQGTTVIDLTRDNGTPESDLVTGITTLTYGGSLVLTNAGTTELQLNDVFHLFSAGAYNGGFTSVTPPAGYTIDTNNLIVDGTVKVTGVPGAQQPQFSGFTKLSDGTFQLTFSGVEGQSYRIWATTDITLTPVVDTWTQVGSGTFGAIPVEFTDADALGVPARFYTISVP
jgi:autotransporter-associated beta strand protein